MLEESSVCFSGTILLFGGGWGKGGVGGEQIRFYLHLSNGKGSMQLSQTGN